MNKKIVEKKLSLSLSRLVKFRGNITIEDIEAEVINNACLIYLQQKNHGVLPSNVFYINKLAMIFTDVAQELFPDQYLEDEITSAQMQIPQNIKWDGMWNFLKRYFMENHHIEIDEVELETKDFNSRMHQRYEHGINVSGDDLTPRLVSIDYIGGYEKVQVRISPTLSPKEATLHYKSDDKIVYHSNDGTYVFTIFSDEFEEIESFVLDIPARGLQIKYF